MGKKVNFWKNIFFKESKTKYKKSAELIYI